MAIIGLVGTPGGARTTLMVDLVSELSRRGLAVSTVIAAEDADGIDSPGKDSHRHRAAGAAEVMVTSARRWALIHGQDRNGAGPAGDHSALARLSPVDLVIAEDAGDAPAIEVYRPADGISPPGRHDGPIIAVVGDRSYDGAHDGPCGDSGDDPNVAVLDLGDVPAIADFIAGHFGLTLR